MTQKGQNKTSGSEKYSEIQDKVLVGRNGLDVNQLDCSPIGGW